MFLYRFRPLLFFCLILLVSCEHEYPSEKDVVNSGYPENIAPLLLRNCAINTCHTGPESPESLDLSTWVNMYRGSDFGSVIIPGSSRWSHIFQHINTYTDLGIQATPVMPPDSMEKLSQSEVLLIREWIETGAPNRLGQFYWAAQETQASGKLFTLCAGSDRIAVTDIPTNSIMRMIEVGQYPEDLEAPHFIVLSPDRQYLYVTLIEGGLVEKYRTDNYEFEGRVAIGAAPSIIHLNTTGTRAVITHWNASGAAAKLSMINTEDMSIVQQVKASSDFLSFPHGMEITDDFRTLYVGANEGNYYSKLEIDESGFIGEEKYPVDPINSPVPFANTLYKPYQLFLTPDESTLFVSCNASDEVRVFDTATDTLMAVIPVGDGPRLMAYDPENNQLFVACRNQESFAEQGSLQGCISVIDVGSRSFVQNIYRVGHRPHGVSVDVAGRRLYVSSENTGGVDELHHPLQGNSQPPGKYNVIDLNTLRVLRNRETQVAEFPNALVVSE
ncbi:MAG: beta-propeller fold lactonase family protein [Bacteroidia bacterium]|nr:beta-propeller fold lactonase family protein [Bacteroidia bacterium]